MGPEPIDFDEYYANMDRRQAANNKPQNLNSRVNRTNRINPQLAKTSEKKPRRTKEDSDPIFQPIDGIPKVRAIGAALTGNSIDTLKNFVTRTPYFKTITEQLALLKAEVMVYKKAGDTVNYELTKELISKLSVKKTDLTKKFQKQYSTRGGADKASAINNSEAIKNIREQIKALDQQFANLNPNSLIYALIKVRKDLAIDGRFGLGSNNAMDIDAYLDGTHIDTKSQIDHEKICFRIGELIGMSVEDVKQTKTDRLKLALVEDVDMSQVQDIQDQIAKLKYQMSIETAKLAGNEDITNVMFTTFDYETVDETIPKNILAAANVEYVKMIAFTMCRKNNKLQYLEDAEAYGLLGLAKALNVWYAGQRLATDTPFSFRNVADLYVRSAIKEGLWQLSSSQLGEKAAANYETSRKREIANFKTNNPELMDLDPSMVDSIIASAEGIRGPLMGGTIAETDIVAGFGDGDTDDVWSNLSKDSNEEVDQAGYDALLYSIKALFSLFEQPSNPAAKNDQFKKKIFNRFDYKLFKMWMGIERNVGEDKTRNYTLAEMGMILSDYYASFGDRSHTFTPQAIKDRLTKMAVKIKKLFDMYPTIREGFEYLLNVSHMETTADLLDDLADEAMPMHQQYVTASSMQRTQQYQFQKGIID